MFIILFHVSHRAYTVVYEYQNIGTFGIYNSFSQESINWGVVVKQKIWPTIFRPSCV